MCYHDKDTPGIGMLTSVVHYVCVLFIHCVYIKTIENVLI